MKISLAWLQEFLKQKISSREISTRLTLHTAELEETIDTAQNYKGVVVGKLLSCAHHPEADTLHVAQFDLGTHGTKQILFGQKHVLKEGGLYPIALPGTTLPSGIEVKDGEIRGEKSAGMVCDTQELGWKCVDMLRIPEGVTPGTPLAQALPFLDDAVFDIDNKSLTHRPDLMGHRGFARDISAFVGSDLILPEATLSFPPGANAPDTALATDGCRRFCSLRIDGVGLSPSPDHVRARLEHLGVRAINNLVDITNLIMLEYGQPMHAFDADKVEGTVTIRNAKDGETVVILDGSECKLTSEDIVVADAKKILSVAGIMGGLECSVSDTTKNLFLEVANFDPVRIRRTSQRLGLRSESSMRYEKSLDPFLARSAILGAAEMFLSACAGAKVVSHLGDIFPSPPKPKHVTLRTSRLQKVSGIDISHKEAAEKLTALGFRVQEKDDRLECEVPSIRATKDIEYEEDLIEEVVRLHGYEDIPPTLPELPLRPPRKNILRSHEWDFAGFWAQEGFSEVRSYSFVSEDIARQFGVEQTAITIENPLSAEYTHMRTNLLMSLLHKVESEVRTHATVRLFELGRVFLPVAGEALPDQPVHALVLIGAREGTTQNMFRDIAASAQRYFSGRGLSAQFVPEENPEPFAHPTQCAAVVVEGERVGTVASLHPQFSPVRGGVFAFLEWNLEALSRVISNREVRYAPLSHFPPVRRDISLVMPARTHQSDLIAAAKETTPLLRDMQVFDEYRDAKVLGEGYKNLSFHLTFQSDEKTLEEAEIDAAFDGVVGELERTHQAVLRLVFDTRKASR